MEDKCVTCGITLDTEKVILGDKHYCLACYETIPKSPYLLDKEDEDACRDCSH